MPGTLHFDDPRALEAALALSNEQRDALDFGVILLDAEGRVVHYNRWESEHSGLSPEFVHGRRFFVDVGPCMNNPLVAGRYASNPVLDETFDWVFTFRLQVSPVTLRLIRNGDEGAMFVRVRA